MMVITHLSPRTAGCFPFMACMLASEKGHEQVLMMQLNQRRSSLRQARDWRF
jgi:hypothetical protein